ncbi:MAG: hypothetical protein V2B20_02460 [Pseudomonadota bacterium]
MKQYTENQYDDDLTLGNDEYDDSYYTDADDLFEFSTDDESPISRLKSLVLSIDWEITDEVLLQFNEELLDLKSIWAGETIYLVYVQALEKISKYIYQNKADSHPNAIKLLLTFYYNLEKIVSSQDLSEDQKKEILLEDVKKFENLKRQIKQKTSSEATRRPEKLQTQKDVSVAPVEDELLNLKAIVLGIDWEIGDKELNDLRSEVSRLEEKYSGSRPKLILLQGIGTLAAYIKVKKSNAHPDAFIVMQLFYESLEKIVQKPMSFEEEKSILFPAVEKFNSFKALLGPTISTDPMEESDDEEAEDYGSTNGVSEISPALTDVSEDEEVGFQAEEEAMALGLDESGGVTSHIDDFFGESSLNNNFAENVTDKDVSKHRPPEDTDKVKKEISRFDVEPVVPDKAAQQKEELMLTQEVIVSTAETIFPSEAPDFPEVEKENDLLDRKKALQGVDVETEADDDSDELSLPMEGEEFAPALVSMEEESLFSATTLDRGPASSSVTEEIVDTIDGLFSSQDEAPVVPAFSNTLEEESVVDTNEEVKNDEELIGFEDWLKEESREEEPVLKADVAPVAQDANIELSHTAAGDSRPVLEEDEVENQLTQKDFVEDQVEDNLNSFFTDSDFDENSENDSEIDALFESLETDILEEKEDEIPVEILKRDEDSFDSDQEQEESVEDELALSFPENRDEDIVEKSVSALFADTDFVEDEVGLDIEPIFPADGGEPKAVPVESVEEPAEEEVVFELFKEVIEPDIAAEPRGNEEEELSSDESWMAKGESLISGFSESPENEIVEEWVDDSVITVEKLTKLEPLGDLQACIDSLKIEINDTIIVGLFQEINILRQKWVDKPLEKIFLQLLSTVAQHIDSYRYESSAEAYGLLVSVCGAMLNLKDSDAQNNLELLLVENLKVLEWQQGMLSRQAVKKGSQLTFAEPLRTEKMSDEQSDAQKDFDDLFEHYEDQTAEDISKRHEYLGDTANHTDSMPAFTEDAVESNEQLLDGDDSEAMRESFAEDLRKEIAVLRQTLKNEIADLRREFKKE